MHKNWFKWLLYIICTAACGFAGYLIYYAAQNGTLYSELLEHYIIKLLILGIPSLMCIVIDFLYQPYEMMEAFAWKNSVGAAFLCLLIGYIIIGDKQEIHILHIPVSVSLIYILTYAIPVAISFLSGIVDIYIGEDPDPKAKRDYVSDEEYRKLVLNKREMFLSDSPPSTNETITDAYGRPRPF